jgi:DNA-binding SARP family transcriptional activator
VTEGRTRVFLAGGLCIETPSGLVSESTFRGRQTRQCFARLVGAQGQPVSREELADELWPDELPDAWEIALRAIVSKVRVVLTESGLPGASISQVSGAYLLTLPPGAWLDIAAAADAIHRAETDLAHGDAGAACGWALSARAISSRPLLPGLDGPWLERERGRLADILLRALTCLAEIWIQKGDAALAARDAEEAIRLDPFREPSHRLLIRALLAAGDRAAAVRAFERCRLTLRDELGVDPSTETLALVASLRPTGRTARPSEIPRQDPRTS